MTHEELSASTGFMPAGSSARQALDWIGRGDVRRALDWAVSSLRDNPSDVMARHVASIAFRKSGQLDAARQHAERAAALAPFQAAVRLNLGLLLRRCGEPVWAYRELELVSRLQPDWPDVRLEISRACAAAGWAQDSLQWAQREAARTLPLAAMLAMRGAHGIACPAVVWGHADYRFASGSMPAIARRWPHWSAPLGGDTLLLWWEPRLDFNLAGLTALAAVLPALPPTVYLVAPAWVEEWVTGRVRRIDESALPSVPRTTMQLPLGEVPSLLASWSDAMTLPRGDATRWANRLRHTPGGQLGISVRGDVLPPALADWLRRWKGPVLPYLGRDAASVAGSGLPLQVWCAEVEEPSARRAAFSALDELLTDDPDDAALAGAMGIPTTLLADEGGDWPWQKGIAPFAAVVCQPPSALSGWSPRGVSVPPTLPAAASTAGGAGVQWVADVGVAKAHIAALTRAGSLAQAAHLLSGVMRHNGSDRAGWVQLSDLSRVAGDARHAAEAARQAIRLNPNAADGFLYLGNALQGLGQHEAALAAYQRAVERAPDWVTVHNNLGVLLKEMRRFPDGEAAYRRAIALAPDYLAPRLNLGNLLRDDARLEAALACYRDVTERWPGEAEGWFGLGNTLMALAATREAIDAFEQALRLDPGHIDAQINLSLMYMLSGHLARGLDLYQQRFFRERRPVSRRPFNQPWWTGDPQPDGHLLLWGEQGAGDRIMFSRLLPEALARVGTVTLESDARLVSLLQRSFPAARVIPERSTPLAVTREASLQAPIGALARYFRRDLGAFDEGGAYLLPDPVRVASWRAQMKQLVGRRIGLVWAGSPGHQNDRNRSLSLAQFAPLFQVPDCHFVSLQLGRARAQIGPSGLPLMDVADGLKDYDDTAALVANLDLVIGVDTSVMHLTGALGVPGWVLIPYAADWRWMEAFPGSTPWYESLRLFRQARRQDWQSVIDRVAAALRENR